MTWIEIKDHNGNLQLVNAATMIAVSPRGDGCVLRWSTEHALHSKDSYDTIRYRLLNEETAQP